MLHKIIYRFLLNPAGGEDIAPELLVEAAFTGEELVEVTAVEGGETEEGQHFLVNYWAEGFHQVEDKGVVVSLVEVTAGGIETFDGDRL